MIQVVKREFEKIDDLVKYVNNTSINYGYLKDYQIIKENDKYNAILNFDVPEVCDFFEFAKLSLLESKDKSIYRLSYNIDVEVKNKDILQCSISFQDLNEGFVIQGSFGYKNIFNLIQINYDNSNDYFTVILGTIGYESKMDKEYIKNILCVEYIDHEVIYNHVVKLLFNRGYLINKVSLKDLKKNLYYVAKSLNRRNFIKDKK